MSEELKPCPWCEDASDVTVFERKHKLNGHIVNCITCGTSSWAYQSKEEAVEAWNSRAKPTFTKEDADKALLAISEIHSGTVAEAKLFIRTVLNAVGRVEE